MGIIFLSDAHLTHLELKNRIKSGKPFNDELNKQAKSMVSRQINFGIKEWE